MVGGGKPLAAVITLWVIELSAAATESTKATAMAAMATATITRDSWCGVGGKTAFGSLSR